MITVQETTVWSGNFPNHKYILSDDMRWAYGYVRAGEKYPTLFNKPMSMDWRGRTYKVVKRTKDVRTDNRQWKVAGSKGDTYLVTETNGEYKCTCPAALYRNTECKHIQKIKQEVGIAKR